MTELVTFVATGTPANGSGFITVIRAFALCGKLGDRLLVQGSGKRRSRLVKWVNALRIEDAVYFTDGDDQDLQMAASATIALSLFNIPGYQTWRSSRKTSIRVMAINHLSMSGVPEIPYIDVVSGDVLALCRAMHAMMTVRRFSQNSICMKQLPDSG